MPRFYLEKLVRDKIVPNCETDDSVVHVSFRVLDGTELRREQVRKVIEEAEEVPLDDSNRQELLGEIADLQAIVNALRESAGFSGAEIDEAVSRKEGSKGGFDNRHYVDYVDLADDSPWIDVFRDQPHKYREEPIMSNEDENSPKYIEPGTYIHTKTKKPYTVIGTALHTETNKLLAIYKPDYPCDHELFARPADMFQDQVVIDGTTRARFVRRQEKK